MRRSLLLLSVLSLLLVFAGCSSEPAATTEPAATHDSAAPDASADPLTGTWKGDWGPSEKDRNPVTLDLKLDGTNVTGTVNPGGPNEVALTKGAFAKDTNMVTLEADAKDHAGNARIEPAFDPVHVAYAAAELNRRAHHVEDRRHRIVVHRMSLEGAVEVDDVQRLEAHR